MYQRLQPDDMKFNSAVFAAFAWQAAQRDEKLPRPPLPGATGRIQPWLLGTGVACEATHAGNARRAYSSFTCPASVGADGIL